MTRPISVFPHTLSFAPPSWTPSKRSKNQSLQARSIRCRDHFFCERGGNKMTTAPESSADCLPSSSLISAFISFTFSIDVDDEGEDEIAPRRGNVLSIRLTGSARNTDPSTTARCIRRHCHLLTSALGSLQGEPFGRSQRMRGSWEKARETVWAVEYTDLNSKWSVGSRNGFVYHDIMEYRPSLRGKRRS